MPKEERDQGKNGGMSAMTGEREGDRLFLSVKRLPKLLVLILLVTGVFSLSACIIAPFNKENAHPDIHLFEWEANLTGASETPPLNTRDKPEEDYFIGLALSGGGSRAANFSAAVMWQLHELGILEKVQYISSVSGGSLTAAYYALFQKDDCKWEKNKLKEAISQNFESSALYYQVRSPGRWIKQISSSYDRTDIMAEVFEDFLYADPKEPVVRTEENFCANNNSWPWTKKFSDLPDKPRLLINATNYIRGGGAFTFTNQNFDKLHADLARLTIGKAVATSAAFPGLLRTSTFADYSTHRRKEVGSNPKCQNEENKKYLHLFDGGVSDNLGIDSLLRVHKELVIKKGKDAFPKGCVIIMVDAFTPYDNESDANRPDTRKWNDLFFFIDMNNIGNAFNILLQTKRRVSLERLGFDSAHLKYAVKMNKPVGFLEKMKTESVSDDPSETKEEREIIQQKRAGCRIWHIAATQFEKMDTKRQEPALKEVDEEEYRRYNEQLVGRYEHLFNANLPHITSKIDEYIFPRDKLKLLRELQPNRPDGLDKFAQLLGEIDTRFRISQLDQDLLYMAAYLLVNEQTSKEAICGWIKGVTEHGCKH